MDRSRVFQRKESRELNRHQDDIIVISSSDGDDDDDDDDKENVEVKYAISSIKLEEEVILISDSDDDDDDDKNGIGDEVLNLVDNDMEDLPSIDIDLVIVQKTNHIDARVNDNVSSLFKANDSLEESFDTKCKVDNITPTRGIKRELDEPQSKICRRKYESKDLDPRMDSCFPVSHCHENVSDVSIETVRAARRHMSYSLLIGGIEGPRHPCSKGRGVCHRKHEDEGKAHSTEIFTDTLFKTMSETMDTYDNYTFHVFTLRAIMHAVTKNQYLSQGLISLLMQYLLGSEEKEEMPGMQELYFGASILQKQLNLHPSCKPNMRQYYLKFCSVWWNALLDGIEKVFNEKKPPPEKKPLLSEQVHAEQKVLFEDPAIDDDMFDISNTVRRKKLSRSNAVRMMTKDEKILRLSILLKFFAELFQSNTSVWLMKSWSSNCGVLRSDICPLLAKLIWENNWANFGAPNRNVKRIFMLYSLSSKELPLHKDLGIIISLIGSILHRCGKDPFPEMNDVTRSYARELYLELKKNVPDIVANIIDLRLDWLRFHVLAFFLDVEEPANFYKVKERVSQVLITKDRGLLIEDPILKEELCIMAVRSMMDMMQIKSSALDQSILDKDILEEEHVWFKTLVEEEEVLKLLKTLKSTLSLPCLKKRSVYFDGFEKCIDSI